MRKDSVKSKRARRGNVKLRRLLGDRHGAQTDFAKKHKLSIGYINNVLTGRRNAGQKLTRIIEKLA
jgi:hypothetical protein